MKILHTFIAVIIFVVFTSCDTKTKQTKTVLNVSDDVLYLKVDDNKNIIVRKDYYGTYSFSSWNDYSVVNIQVHQVENLGFNSSSSRIESIKKNVLNLSTTIPTWLKTNKVLENIKNVQEQYEILLEQKDKSTSISRQNWKNLSEQFIGLREALSETAKSYKVD